MRLSTRLTLAMVGLVVLTAAAVGALIHRNIEQRALPRALDRIDIRAHLLTLQLEASVGAARADVSVQGQAVRGLVRATIAGSDADPATGTTVAQWKMRLASRFVAELKAKPEYSQFRVIGIADQGREVVRVDRMGPDGAIRTVPDAELQRKGDRSYFKAAVELPPGQLYASPIDLNQEGGAFEKPYVPTLRVAAPIAGPSGERFGIMIVNIDMRPVFAQLRSAGTQGQVYIVNEQGDYLVHPDASREFGFEFGTPFRIQDDFPDFKELLGGSATPPRVIRDRAGAAFGIGWNSIRLAGGPRISVVEAVPASQILVSTSATPIVIGALVVAIAALPLAFFLARSLSRPLVQMTRAIEAFGHGITMPAPVSSSGEIGVLARAFSRMADEVREKTDALEHENAQRRDSERIAQGIITYSLDAIIQVNEAGEVIEWNPQAETMLGWSRAEALGRPISELYLPKGYRPRYLDMNERLRREDTIIGDRFDFEAVCKDGRTIRAEVSMTGVRRRDGNVFNLFLRDITQKLAAEEQMRQSQKMEAVGQLTGGIAHDFNNMLTVITGTIEILEDALADKPQLAAIARLISEAADRGAELTSHLLAFARKQPLQPRDTDVNTLMWNSAKLLKPALGENVEIELKLDEDARPALIDPNQLVTALLNLAVNARDAMPDGGKLTLETRNVVLDMAYCQNNSEVKPGHYVMIAVSDTGHGMSKSILDKIFDPFFSTKETGKGTGLGLSMVYGFVKQSDGHIKAYSEEGHGTTIRMYLPQAGAQPVQGAQAEPSTMESGSETILVVEDDAMVRASVITQLQSLGYQTIAAGSGDEALAIVDGGAAFDLLFTDVILTKPMNGRQLAEEIERRRPGTKVLFTSGYTENAIIHHGRLDPGVLLLAKPYRKSDLARMLRVALDGDAGAVGAATKPRVA